MYRERMGSAIGSTIGSTGRAVHLDRDLTIKGTDRYSWLTLIVFMAFVGIDG